MRMFIAVVLLFQWFLCSCRQELTDPSDPEIEQEQLMVAPGYEVSLFAAEPMLANPVQMAWDTRGAPLGALLAYLSAAGAGRGAP